MKLFLTIFFTLTLVLSIILTTLCRKYICFIAKNEKTLNTRDLYFYLNQISHEVNSDTRYILYISFMMLTLLLLFPIPMYLLIISIGVLLLAVYDLLVGTINLYRTKQLILQHQKITQREVIDK